MTEEKKGWFLRTLGFVEKVFDFGERLWSVIVVGGLLAFAAAMFVLSLIREG